MIFDRFGLRRKPDRPSLAPIRISGPKERSERSRYIFVEDVNVDQLVFLTVIEVQTVFTDEIRL